MYCYYYYYCADDGYCCTTTVVVLGERHQRKKNGNVFEEGIKLQIKKARGPKPQTKATPLKNHTEQPQLRPQYQQAFARAKVHLLPRCAHLYRGGGGPGS